MAIMTGSACLEHSKGCRRGRDCPVRVALTPLTGSESCRSAPKPSSPFSSPLQWPCWESKEILGIGIRVSRGVDDNSCTAPFWTVMKKKRKGERREFGTVKVRAVPCCSW